MTKKSKTATSKPTTEKAATVHHLDGKATKTNTTNKKENWLQIHVECTVNTDVAPKWLKEKMNYLQMNEYSKFDKEEQALADFFGKGNFVPFYKKHLKQGKLKITSNDFIAGEIETMFTAMKQLDIHYEYNDYPKCLYKYLHRRIWESSIRDIKTELFDKCLCFINPVFIKPKDKLKKFTYSWYLMRTETPPLKLLVLASS